MRAHTKIRHTKINLGFSEVESEERAISATDYYKQSYGNFPKWAVLLRVASAIEKGLPKKSFRQNDWSRPSIIFLGWNMVSVQSARP
jgi:hypothetical protein